MLTETDGKGLMLLTVIQSMFIKHNVHKEYKTQYKPISKLIEPCLKQNKANEPIQDQKLTEFITDVLNQKLIGIEKELCGSLAESIIQALAVKNI